MNLEPATCVVCKSSRSRFYAEQMDLEYETTQTVFVFVQCLECSHVYLNPRPQIHDSPLIYGSDYYTVQQNSGLAAKILEHIKIRIVSSRIKTLIASVKPGGTVLEIGCGDGSNLMAVRELRPDLRLIGVDLCFSRYSKKRLINAGIELFEDTFEHVQLYARYDLVIMNQLIEHLWNVRASLGKIRDGLCCGGLVSICTPNFNGYDRKWFGNLWGGFHTPRHLNVFSEVTLSKLLHEFDFEVVQEKKLFAPLIWVTSVHNYFKKQGTWWYRIFKYSNLPVLVIFCLLDWIMVRLKKKTSNMQLIAIKKKGSPD